MLGECCALLNSYGEDYGQFGGPILPLGKSYRQNFPGWGERHGRSGNNFSIHGNWRQRTVRGLGLGEEARIRAVGRLSLLSGDILCGDPLAQDLRETHGFVGFHAAENLPHTLTGHLLEKREPCLLVKLRDKRRSFIRSH